MKTELIKALKETVLDLKLNRKDYDWWEVDSCNCGILAQNVCNMNTDSLRQNRDDGSWELQCAQTGENVSVVMSKMLSVGLTKEDIINLECLSDDSIRKEVGGGGCLYYGCKEDVIKYMEAWIRILEREEVVPEEKQINAAPNKSMEFIKYEEMKSEMELLFQN